MRPLGEVEAFLVERLPPGIWLESHRLPRPLYHWLAAHMRPNTLRDFLKARPGIFVVEDSQTDKSKFRFTRLLLPCQPLPGVSQVVTAQAPAQAVKAQAPIPQPPQPGIGAGGAVKPPPGLSPPPGGTVPLPMKTPPMKKPPTPPPGGTLPLPVKSPPMQKPPTPDFEAQVATLRKYIAQRMAAERRNTTMGIPWGHAGLRQQSAQAPDPINTPPQAPAAAIPTPPPDMLGGLD